VGAIRLLNVPFFGHHGVSRAEREAGTLLELDLELDLDLEPAAASDQVRDTVNYMDVHEEVLAVVRDDRFNLLESLAATIADRLLARFDARQVTVRIRKTNLPLSGGRIEVELTRGAGTRGGRPSAKGSARRADGTAGPARGGNKTRDRGATR
jgi:dihydroneopterin aldolase